MRIGLIPLDERPVNTRYVEMIADVAGVEVALPPRAVLSDLRRPADCAALADWLRVVFPSLDALIVSLEMFGYGSLIASRTTHEPVATILARLDVLRDLKRTRPEVPILGFNLITRISNADDSTEEPEYWAHYGTRFYRFSQLADMAAQGLDVQADLAAVQAELPQPELQDFLRRRARNHTVNLAALQLLADGALDTLVLSSDDTSPYGLGSREKRWLAEWAARLNLGERLLMYPGADEVGCVLLARLLNRRAGALPRFRAFYSVPGGEQIVAPYEDGPVRVTVERQVLAAGGTLTDADDAELWVAVNTPVARRSEWAAEFAAQERTERWVDLERFSRRTSELLAQGHSVIVTDVAYPNGADPVLTELLFRDAELPRLAAYGAWNTAGNTIGTALAHGVAARLITTPEQHEAHLRFVLRHLLEDWGYQQEVRRETAERLIAETGTTLIAPENLAPTCAAIEARLNELLATIPGFEGWRVTNTRLPWRRLFEVDFDLVRL